MLFSRQASSLKKAKLPDAFSKSRFSNSNIGGNNPGLDYEYKSRTKQTVTSHDQNPNRLESLGESLQSGSHI